MTALNHQVEPPLNSSAPSIRLRGLRKTFGEVVAVDSVDLDIADGEFLTLLGPSGSGKTTVLRMIAGFELPTEGLIELAGVDVSRLPPFQRNVNTVFQDYALFPHLSVQDNVEYGLKVKKVGKAERRRRANEALDAVRPVLVAGASAGPALTLAAQERCTSPRCCTSSSSVHSGQVGTGTSRPGAEAIAARKATERSSISRSRRGNSKDVSMLTVYPFA